MARTAARKHGDEALPAWVRGATGRGVRVGVIDSGWDRTRGDPRVASGAGFVAPEGGFALHRSGDDHDRAGHGTACAQVILRLAPAVQIVPLRVFGAGLETSPEALGAALEWAADEALPVVNLSLGTTLEAARAPLLAACRRARRAGTVIVAAAPNRGGPAYPAAFPEVIGVDAGRFPSPWHFRFRPGAATECTAPGYAPPLPGEEEPRYGTSFAAPHIAAVVALILERHAKASLEEVRRHLAALAAD